MRLGLVLSNDWELYGDGSGDYFGLQRRPLREMLDLAAEFGAKLTLMAEVGQQWAHQQQAAQEDWAAEIAAAWEADVVEAARCGADVQLHLHSQWLDAQWRGAWHLDLNRWCVSALPAAEQVRAFRRGKQYLESLVSAGSPRYACAIFRAGAYCLEPSAVVVASLQQAGLDCDTSVTKGLTNPGFFDFRDAESSLFPWWIGERGVKYAGRPGGLIELPIFAAALGDSPLLRKLTGFTYTRWVPARERRWQAKRRDWLSRCYSSAKRPHPPSAGIAARNSSRLSGALFRTATVPLDYDGLPASVFVDLLDRLGRDDAVCRQVAHLEQQSGTEITLPVMASGHTKVMMDCENFRWILRMARERLGDRMMFLTATEALSVARTILAPSAQVPSRRAG